MRDEEDGGGGGGGGGTGELDDPLDIGAPAVIAGGGGGSLLDLATPALDFPFCALVVGGGGGGGGTALAVVSCEPFMARSWPPRRGRVVPLLILVPRSGLGGGGGGGALGIFLE